MMDADRPYSKVRLRIGNVNRTLPKADEDTYNAPFQKKPPIQLINIILLMIFAIGLYGLVIICDKWLPNPLSVTDQHNHKDRFIAERAKGHLFNLTRMGPRIVGSYANEVKAVNFLTNEIKELMRSQPENAIHNIALDVQKVSGSFPLTFLDYMTNVYKHVQNVVVKIGSKDNESKHSLLVNCHFDSAVSSPGGSDDGASCAIMLEILRVISKSNIPLRHNIIFLFNGAEEDYLQGSHGFITQHAWAKSVRAFINMEACGAGGREVLFQAGPENPWLIKAYIESVPYPFASFLAQEIFQSGLVPGDTDYRIFRDFGHIPGLDFAWTSNGYVYHTYLDDIHQVSSATLQRTGDNILQLILRIVNENELSNVEGNSKGNLVFFDFLGLFVISMSESTANIINIFVLMLTVYTIKCNIDDSIYKGGTRSKVYVRGVFWASCIVIISWISTFVIVGVVAYLLTLIGKSFSWFAKPIWLLFLYVIPTFIIPIFIYQMYDKKVSPVIRNIWVRYGIYEDGIKIIFLSVSSLLMLFEIRCAFIPIVWLAFVALSNILTKYAQWKDFRWLWLRFTCLSLPFTLSCYWVHVCISFLIPIMGRIGSGLQTEVIFAIIISFMFVMIFTFFVPMTILIQECESVVKTLFGVFVCALVLLITTSYGFPYSGDISSPAPQRYAVAHTQRTFYDINGHIKSEKSGIWIVNLDINSPYAISAIVPNITRAQLTTDDCKNELYCGMPYFLPISSTIWKTHWIPMTPPTFNTNTPLVLNMTYRDYRRANIQRLFFSLRGPDHMTLFLSPYAGAQLKGWSFNSQPPLKGPIWKKRPTYFVYYSFADLTLHPEPWNFWIDIEVDKDHNGAILEIGHGGHYLHGDNQLTPELKRFFSYFPSWTATSGWTSSYNCYTF